MALQNSYNGSPRLFLFYCSIVATAIFVIACSSDEDSPAVFDDAGGLDSHEEVGVDVEFDTSGDLDVSGDPDTGEEPDIGDDPDTGEVPDSGGDPDTGEEPDIGDDPDTGEDPDAGYEIDFTHYVRPDGGDAEQCTGEADAPYPGSGMDQDCAWKHPFIAFPPGQQPRIEGGDTLHVASGSYMMGVGAPGANNCSEESSGSCFMSAVPSGPSASEPTRILGEGFYDGCTNAPKLWGTDGASLVMNLRGSSHVEIACFEITDREACAVWHCNEECDGTIAPCESGGQWADTGLSGRDSTDVLLRDLNIHGMGQRGINAGRIGDWTLERVILRANGWSGWDGSIGDDSANSGEIIFRESEISWNGCIEEYPGPDVFGCWGQIGGGWGDGLGTASTGGHWIFEDSRVNHNTSDGIDLLYLSDGGEVTIRRTHTEGNAGNQIKSSRSTWIENSVVVSNCTYFEDHGNMYDFDHCRANGDAIYVGLGNSAQTTLVNNTITGEGGCLVSSGSADQDSSIHFANNLMIGHLMFDGTDRQSCAFYDSSGNAQVEWTNNLVYEVRNNACPGDSICDQSPMITDSSLFGFEPIPLENSPLIDAADAALAPDLDFRGYPRFVGEGPDIGALEYGATP